MNSRAHSSKTSTTRSPSTTRCARPLIFALSHVFYSARVCCLQFHTSQNSPSKDPLVTWHQGGPGASSINLGLYTEMGYFLAPIDYFMASNKCMKHTLGRPFYTTSAAEQSHGAADACGGDAIVAPLVVGSTGWLSNGLPARLALSDGSGNGSASCVVDESNIMPHRVVEGTRSRISEHWAASAAAEHASVAAFHKHSLELLSIGAPIHLLRGAARAASDEIEHAALSFGLAAAYHPDRKVVGPGSLPSFASTPAADTHPAAATATDLARVALSAARDGGVHETIAAIEAMLAYHCASEPAVVSALNIISEDEARHAVLSWEVIEYAVGVDPSLAPLIAESIEGALRVMVVGEEEVVHYAGGEWPCAAQEEAELRHAGVLSEAQRAWARHVAIERVIRPAARRVRQGVGDVAKEVAGAFRALVI